MLSGSCGVWLSCVGWEHVHFVVVENLCGSVSSNFFVLRALVDSKMSFTGLRWTLK